VPFGKKTRNLFFTIILVLVLIIKKSLVHCSYSMRPSPNYSSLSLTCLLCNVYRRFLLTVIAADEHSAGSSLSMPGGQTGSEFVDESKRKMGLLRLGRGRSMSLLRLGRGDAEPSEEDKRSMGLLRLGRKRSDDDGEDFMLSPEDIDDQRRPSRCVIN